MGSGGGSGAEPNAWLVTVPQSAVQAVEAGAVDGLASVDVSATVSNAAGNPATTPATVTISADFNGPSITIDAIADDNVINIAERDDAGGITISGSTGNVPQGQDVTVTLNGTVLSTVQAGATGQWQVNVPQGDASLPSDGNSVTVTASVEDTDGIEATDNVQLAADFTAPTISINDIAVDDVINSDESTQPLTISGSTAGAEAGRTVTLGIPGLSGLTDDVDAGGDWSVTLTAEQTEALVTAQGDGANFDVTANVTDAAGNPAPEATRPVSIDVTPPTVEIDALSLGGDNTLNITESQSSLDITGTAIDTGEVTVTFNGTALPPAPVTGGTWAVTIPAADLGALPDGTIDITAEGTDDAGNVGQDSRSFEADLTPPTIAITNLSTGNTLTLDEFPGGLTIDGTASVDTVGNSVTVSVNGTGFVTNVETGGAWSRTLNEQELTGLGLPDQANITVNAKVQDDSGNETTATPDNFTTDFAPSLTIDEIGEDGAVDLSDPANASITGTTFGVEQGQQVTVTATGTVSGVILNSTAAVAADGTWSLPVAPAFFDALEPGETFTVDATVDNAAGRTASDAQAGIDAYLAAAYAVANTAEAGTTLTMTAFAAEGFDAVQGIEPDMNFDPALATYVTGSETFEFDLFTVNDTNAATGFVGFIGGNLTAPIPEGEELFGFDMEDQGAGPITLSFTDEAQGGSTELQIGTAGVDTLTAASTDSVIQGKGDDDDIDVSATGANRRVRADSGLERHRHGYRLHHRHDVPGRRDRLSRAGRPAR